MKTYGILCFVLALFMILTPLLSLDYSSFSLSNVKSTFQKENDSEDEEKLLDEKSDSVKIKSAASGNVATASTKEYIIGCVAAEMPATYSTEALKAQAVSRFLAFGRRHIGRPRTSSGVLRHRNTKGKMGR